MQASESRQESPDADQGAPEAGVRSEDAVAAGVGVQAGIGSASNRGPARPARLPLRMRAGSRRFGPLSNRLSPLLVALCRLVTLAGAAGWALIASFLVGWQTRFSGAMDMTGAVILAMGGAWCQYKLLLHFRECEASAPAAVSVDTANQANRFYVPLPRQAHQPVPHSPRLLAAAGTSQHARLRRLHGHAWDHLRRFPSSDKLSAAEAFACLLFSALAAWCAAYLYRFHQHPPLVPDWRSLAGACIGVAVGTLLLLRLLMFLMFLSVGIWRRPTPQTADEKPSDVRNLTAQGEQGPRDPAACAQHRANPATGGENGMDRG